MFSIGTPKKNTGKSARSSTPVQLNFYLSAICISNEQDEKTHCTCRAKQPSSSAISRSID